MQWAPLGIFPKLGYRPLLEQDPRRRTQVRDKKQSLFLVSYGRASLRVPCCLFFFNLIFLLPSQQGICCISSQPSDGNLWLSLQGCGQTKGPTLRYRVVLIGSKSLMFRIIPKDEIEMQNQGSPQMATRRFLAHQKNN